MRFVFASSSAFCNANNNGNANNNSAGNADNYVRPRFEWRAAYLWTSALHEGNLIPFLKRTNRAGDAD